jgi:protein-disulfide isomerase
VVSSWVGGAVECKPSTPMVEMKAGSNDVIATIKGVPITDAELRNIPEVKMNLYQASVRVYEAEEREQQTFKAALDSFIEEKLLADAAKAKGVTVEEFVKNEVEKKIGNVSDVEVKKFYDEKKINRPLDQIKDKIVEYLKNQKMADARKSYIDSLKKESQVVINLPDFNKAKPMPPKIEVAFDKEMPARGPNNAPITIVEFSDYQCPYCKRAEESVKEVLKKYKKEVKLVFRHYPLPFHNEAKPAAIAATCANDQNKFWQFHDMLFENQNALKESDLSGYAKKLGLNEKKFSECVSAKKFQSVIDRDLEDGKKYGVSGTPAFFINGRMLSGARPFEDFEELIRAELNAKKQGA